MWKRLTDFLAKIWKSSTDSSENDGSENSGNENPGSRATTKARARFWAELREGEREAKNRASS